MHLLALGAFWLQFRFSARPLPTTCLNAPFGARCFVTLGNGVVPQQAALGLNAPYGARCFLARYACVPQDISPGES